MYLQLSCIPFVFFKLFKGRLPLLRWWQALEMARSENLNEEDESNEEGHDIESHHNHGNRFTRQCRLLTGYHGKVRGEHEENHHQQQHADNGGMEL